MSLSVLPKTRAGLVLERIHKTGTGAVLSVGGLITRKMQVWYLKW
jgi:hypothetical protein